MRWTWKSLNGVAKNEIYYILINKPYIVTDVTVINQVTIESDHRLVMSNINLDVEMERNIFLTKSTQIGSKKFETQQELDDIDTTRETITDMIQQSASRVAKAINKPLKSRISSPT